MLDSGWAAASGSMWGFGGEFACRDHARVRERAALSRGGAVIYDGAAPRAGRG